MPSNSTKIVTLDLALSIDVDLDTMIPTLYVEGDGRFLDDNDVAALPALKRAIERLEEER